MVSGNHHASGCWGNQGHQLLLHLQDKAHDTMALGCRSWNLGLSYCNPGLRMVVENGLRNCSCHVLSSVVVLAESAREQLQSTNIFAGGQHAIDCCGNQGHTYCCYTCWIRCILSDWQLYNISFLQHRPKHPHSQACPDYVGFET